MQRVALACVVIAIAAGCGNVRSEAVDAGDIVDAGVTDEGTVRYKLSVALAGNGMGTVLSTPAGINCGGDCSETYDSGSAITLTATAGSGATFLGWTGGGCSGTAPCVLTLGADTTVTAAFALSNSLIVTLAGNGSGSVSSSPAGISCGSDCSEAYVPNTSVMLTASPAIGSTFTGWSGGGCSGTGTCSVTITNALMVTATFTLAQFALTVTIAGGGTGLVTSDPAGISCSSTCTANYNFGTMVTLSPAPGDQVSRFARWSGGCSGAAGCVVTVMGPTTVTASFDRRGVLYTIRDGDDMVQRMDPVSGTITNIGGLGVDFAFGDCAWDSANNTLYMVPRAGTGMNANTNLYRVNTSTGAATVVGTHGIIDMRALAFNPVSNTLYAHGNTNGSLYTINVNTGAATFVGTGNVGILDALAWDTSRNRMVGVTADATAGELFTVNLTNGAVTSLGTAGPTENAGMAYDPVIDRYWVVDFNGQLFQYDPSANMARTDLPGISGAHTCLTFRP